jgi:hypothetical protein
MRRRGRLTALLVAGTVLVYVGAFGIGRLRSAWRPEALKVSETDAAALSRAVAGHVWPDRQNVTLTPDVIAAREDGGLALESAADAVMAWQVTCEGADGETLGTVTLDGTTGELISVVAGCRGRGESGMPTAEMPAANRRGVLRQWMRDLEGARHAGTWRETAETSAEQSLTSEWTAPGRKAHLCINPSTGELIMFRVARRGAHALAATVARQVAAQSP